MDAYLTAMLDGAGKEVDLAKVDSMEAIQEVIDGTNFDAVEAEFITGTTLETDIDENSKLDELLAALEALEALKVVDEDVQEAIDELVEDIEAQIEAIEDALTAAQDAVAAAKVAMTDYEEAMGDDFDETVEAYKDVKDLVDAFEELDLEKVTETNLTDITEGIGDGEDGGALNELLDAIYDIEVVQIALAAIEAFEAAYAVHNDMDDITDVAEYDALMKILYGDGYDLDNLELEDDLDSTDFDDEIESLEKVTADWVKYNAIKAAKSKEDLTGLLQALAIEEFIDLKPVQRLEVAGIIFEALADEESEIEELEDVTDLLEELSGDYANLIEKINDGTKVSEIRAELAEVAELLGIELDEDADMVAMADAVLESPKHGSFVTLADIVAAMGL